MSKNGVEGREGLPSCSFLASPPLFFGPLSPPLATLLMDRLAKFDLFAKAERSFSISTVVGGVGRLLFAFFFHPLTFCPFSSLALVSLFALLTIGMLVLVEFNYYFTPVSLFSEPFGTLIPPSSCSFLSFKDLLDHLSVNGSASHFLRADFDISFHQLVLVTVFSSNNGVHVCVVWTAPRSVLLRRTRIALLWFVLSFIHPFFHSFFHTRIGDIPILPVQDETGQERARARADGEGRHGQHAHF